MFLGAGLTKMLRFRKCFPEGTAMCAMCAMGIFNFYKHFFSAPLYLEEGWGTASLIAYCFSIKKSLPYKFVKEYLWSIHA